MRLVPAILVFMFSLVAGAASEVAVSTAPWESRMPGTFRIGMFGSMIAKSDQGEYINATETDDKANAAASVITGIGSGMFSFEFGASYLKIAETVSIENTAGTTEKYLVNSQYIGVPAWLKWNHIERPLSSFFIKLGAMPVFLLDQGSAIGTIEAIDQSTFVVAGIGGTTDIGESSAFLLDISFIRNIGTENKGLPTTSVLIGMGFSYDL